MPKQKPQQIYNTMRKNVLKYPEHLKIRAKLNTEDKLEIAKATGYKEGTIREMLNGYRRMPDKVKRAILELFEEKKKLDNALEEIVNQ